MRKMLLLPLIVLVFTFSPSPQAQESSTTLKKVAEFDLPGPAGKRFDYLTIDPDDHYLISAFFRRFGIAEQDLGFVFFAVHVLNACSHVGAAWLARHIGLFNTMVFTHVPSSFFLIAVPFAPSFKWAVFLFFCREALVEMDVPTRQSYVAAVVLPNERRFASGLTNLARNLFWAVGSTVAGPVMQNLAFSAPLVIGGGVKVAYDLVLYQAFRKVRVPEEHAQTAI